LIAKFQRFRDSVSLQTQNQLLRAIVTVTTKRSENGGRLSDYNGLPTR